MSKLDKVLSRHKAIKKVISNYEIEDQVDLIDILRKKHKIETTQPIVSRDLRKLGINKRKVRDKVIYELSEFDINKEILRLAISDVIHNESLIVIKTMAGTAAFVGDFIDLQDNLEVIGSLAGENVVFVIPKSIKKIKKIFAKVCLSLYFKK